MHARSRDEKQETEQTVNRVQRSSPPPSNGRTATKGRRRRHHADGRPRGGKCGRKRSKSRQRPKRRKMRGQREANAGPSGKNQGEREAEMLLREDDAIRKENGMKPQWDSRHAMPEVGSAGKPTKDRANDMAAETCE